MIEREFDGVRDSQPVNGKLGSVKSAVSLILSLDALGERPAFGFRSGRKESALTFSGDACVYLVDRFSMVDRLLDLRPLLSFAMLTLGSILAAKSSLLCKELFLVIIRT